MGKSINAQSVIIVCSIFVGHGTVGGTFNGSRSGDLWFYYTKSVFRNLSRIWNSLSLLLFSRRGMKVSINILQGRFYLFDVKVRWVNDKTPPKF